ncbi:hypothetical protein CANINC_002286 [Pichia inconspicua]|uniref:LAA1-like C-terminal TPR repeats domain-containing protein n=1 Tax=Pichia inconspicua TaxID=52247 RepID=A0A4T0X1G8_9ASCO|nr:hypothetical protein CANINC_002286 [[Candida] inconspicua]
MVSHLDKDTFLFQNWTSHLIYNNDADANDISYKDSQVFLYTKLTNLHLSLQPINSDYFNNSEDVLFAHEQLMVLINHLFTTYEKSKYVKILSVNLNNLLAKTITFNLSIMMKNGHEKFQICLIELTNKLIDCLSQNIKKLSMSKNWYSSLKHLSVIILKFIFTKFNGFLNNTKQIVCTTIYKLTSKANDSYNSSIENGTYMSNYFSDMIHLIDIILTHDNSSVTLDDKLFTRLIKLFKFVTQKNDSSSSSNYTYPLITINSAFSILVSLLKSDRYMTSLVSKKSTLSIARYTGSIKEYINLIFLAMDTDHKKLKLGLTKNFSDLLVFTFVVFGSNKDDLDSTLDFCIGVILDEYTKKSTTSNQKSAIIETLIQFLTKLNLYYQTNRVKFNKNIDNVNFVSLKIFEILSIIYSRLFSFNQSVGNKLKKTETNILLNNDITMNSAIRTINHLSIVHKFLIAEIANDLNKLIVLSKLVLGNYNTEPQIKIPSLSNVTASNDYNVWYAITLLQLSQILIEDLDEFILSDHGNLGAVTSTRDITTQIAARVTTFSCSDNFKLRIVAVETLIKLLKIKPELSFTIMNNALVTLDEAFKTNENNPTIFNDTYSNAYLISSIVSFVSKDYITSDFVLAIFTLALNFLKKFNSTVVANNLFGSNQGITISNVIYEKQLVSWMLLLSLFNYASTDNNIEYSNVFLHDSNQFIVLWKNILAHTLPNGLIQIDSKAKSITNIDEILKLLEIKNQSLICMVGYVNYLSSNKILFTNSLISQLNQILSKSYSFITSVITELHDIKIPMTLSNSINANKLRIFEVYLKLLPHLNVKNEINSTMLIEIVKNFSDIDKYRYEFVDTYGKYIRNSKKKQLSAKITEYTLYSIDDGVYYGLTSKFNNFKVDELMIKHSNLSRSNNETYNIDLAPLHNNFLVESSTIQSNLSDVTVFDEFTESRAFTNVSHSLLHDSFIFLYTNSLSLGYTDESLYPVATDIMSIDASIELFAIAFPHLSSKIQLSVLESIRSLIFYKTKESITIGASDKKQEIDETTLKQEISLSLRKKASTVNSCIAIHSLLMYMLRYNSSNSTKLRFKKDVSTLIFETLKNITFEDIYLVNLNSESFGICASLVDGVDLQEDILHQQVTLIINAIAETDDPKARAFYIKTLAYLTKYSNMINTSRITNTIFTLLQDPHPLVHSATLYALDTFMNGKSNLEISENLAARILSNFQDIWLSDSFGIRADTTVSSNINYREHSNSINYMIKCVRSLINISGPMIRTWNDKMKSHLNHMLFSFQYLVDVDFEINIREVLKIFEELLVFDKTIINLENYKILSKLLIINNSKVGVYGKSLSNVPLDDEYDNENSFEIFPCTTSTKLLNMALESAFQLFKLEDHQLIDQTFERLLWFALEQDPDNELIKDIVTTLMEDCIEESTTQRLEWFKKLVGYFNISKTELTEPLMDTFAKRINNVGMFFHVTGTTKSIIAKSKVIDDLKPSASRIGDKEDLNEAEEVLTSNMGDSGQVDSDRPNNHKDDDNDDDDDDDEQQHKIQASATDNLFHLLDLSNQQISWKFKLFIIELLNSLLPYCEFDEVLKAETSKQIPELVRISFVSSTSNLISLRIASLRLLGGIIEIFADTKDPLYPDVSILEQQQAQIVSTITPSFDRNSNIDLAGEAIILASKFISSNITNVNKSGRILKILITSLEDLSANDREKKALTIGEIPILTKKSENRIKIYILQAWSKLLILSTACDNQGQELAVLIEKYMKILITLWVYTVREFAMMKYGSVKDVRVNKDNEGWSLELFENCWIDFVESICIVIDKPDYFLYLESILGDDVGKLFMTIFGLCMEYLTKRTNKSNIKYDHNDLRIFSSLKRLFKLDLSVKILFNDYIFTEFIDVINKLIVLSSESNSIDILMNASDFLKDVYLAYFEDLRSNNFELSSKPVEDIYSDFDKLFELIRLNIKIVTMKLPFLRDNEILNLSVSLEPSDCLLIRKCLSAYIEMTIKLPTAIQNDLFSCLMYMFILIHELRNQQLATVLLPVFQKALIEYKALQSSREETNVLKLFKIMKIPSIPTKEDKLLTYIIIKTVSDMILDESDIKRVNSMILDGLTSKDSTLISLSVQTVKSVIDNITQPNSNSFKIIRDLIPLLIATISDTNIQLKEPRLIVEIFISLLKVFGKLDDNIKLESVYKLTIPILVFFNKKYGYDTYVTEKIVGLININPAIFKDVVQVSDDILKAHIKSLVDTGCEPATDVDIDATTPHIQLKTFG